MGTIIQDGCWSCVLAPSGERDFLYTTAISVNTSKKTKNIRATKPNDASVKKYADMPSTPIAVLVGEISGLSL